MRAIYGARDIVRNPSLLRIAPTDSFIVEDKKAHKRLGIYLGADLAQEFFDYIHKQKLLKSAMKIKDSAMYANSLLEESVDDGL
ncbi:hypothetical protein GSY74_02390 [Sulfurovum sp. bin170]|uniref:hypothetical protein n=1 Tax=Sulfurovum sp. bin170 TaxID=2695268 RepID=UPI0013DEBB0F|nr:hypothetical protein [Sulfurovum sp. bin170]NEW60121.1 hypothetical protein [Sulfurovum sp. bin170]